MKRALALCVTHVLLGAGCVGAIDGDAPGPAPAAGEAPPPAGAPERPGTPPPPTAGAPLPPAGAVGGPGPAAPRPATCDPRLALPAVRRLTPDQVANAIRDLLGVDAGDDALPPVRAKGFRTNVDLNEMTADMVVDLGQGAAAIAGRATRDVGKLVGCTPGATADDCLVGYVRAFTRRAYRRPATDAEVQTLTRLYVDLRKAGSAADALAGVIETVLQSPQFLYVAEAVQEAGVPARLDDHELAARLGFLLWDTLPDAELDRAADGGQLRTAAQVEAHARRLMRDPRFAGATARFFEDWLELGRLHGLEKEPKLFPQWGDGLRTAMFRELGAFVGEVLGKGDGKLATFLGARFTVANAPLGALYGVGTGKSDAGFARLDLPAERAGLLTQPGFLAAHASPGESSPIARGAFVRRNALCTPLEVPPGLEIVAPTSDPKLSMRQRLAMHRESPACGACHALMDAIGLGLEGFDAIGRHRTVDEGNRPIDVSGELTAAGDATGPFSGGAQLAARLASSATVRECLSAQVLEHAVGRALEDADVCARRDLAARFEASGGDVRELFVALVTSEAFVSRRTR